MSRLALPARLARREVRRRPGRTLLVALLVALPVAGMAAAVVLIHTETKSGDEEWAGYWGAADARIWTDGVPLPDLPAGSRTLVLEQSWLRVSARDVLGAASDASQRSTSLEVTDAPLDDPLVDGIYALVDGRAPRDPGEITLTRGAASRLRADIGDVLAPARPDIRLEVVGLAEQRSCLTCDVALVAPGTLDDEPAPGWQDNGSRTLIDLPGGLSIEEQVALRARSDDLLELRAEAGTASSPSDRGVRWTYVLGALALTVVGVVITAAFAVGARRQLVTIGQLSASGAPPSSIQTALVLQGTFTGAVGAILGLAIAGIGLRVGHGLVERMLDERISAYDVRPGELVVVAAIGIAAATVAALLPARTAAQIPTLAALAGRRPLRPVPRRVVAGGIAAVVTGLGLLAIAVLGSASEESGDIWALVAIVGGVLELLGVCAVAPAIVARLEPLAARVRGSWRLAARGLARQRSRTGAVVSAVAAACGLAVAATALVLGGEAEPLGHLPPPPGTVFVQEIREVPATDPAEGVGLSEPVAPDRSLVDAVDRALGGRARRIDVRTARLPGVTAGEMWQVVLPDGAESFSYAFADATVADEAVLAVLGVSDEVRRDLERYGMVTLTDGASGVVSAMSPAGQEWQVGARDGRYTIGWSATLLVHPRAAADRGLDVRTTGALLAGSEPLTEEQVDAISVLYEQANEAQLYGTETTVADPSATADTTTYRWVELIYDNPHDEGPTSLQLELLLSGIALVLALFVVGVSLALAAAESKDERDVLTLAGASPRTLARSAGARAWLLAAIGAVLAVPAGFLPVAVFTAADEGRMPLVFPVRTVLLLVVVVPIVCAAVALVASASAQRFRPVRVSTAIFE